MPCIRVNTQMYVDAYSAVGKTVKLEYFLLHVKDERAIPRKFLEIFSRLISTVFPFVVFPFVHSLLNLFLVGFLPVLRSSLSAFSFDVGHRRLKEARAHKRFSAPTLLVTLASC